MSFANVHTGNIDVIAQEGDEMRRAWDILPCRVLI
jgi:hypothetical protein